MTTLKTRVSVLAAFAGGLFLLTALNAEDKPKLPMQPAPAEQPKETIKPKPLSDAVKNGLKYLVKQQHPEGGWGQGGGWRTVDGGGRIEGGEVKDPPDVGNTCIATLALIRAGNTPKEGPYAKEVAKAVEFICGHVAKSDDKSLLVTDIKDTQLQSKIGPYVDTFLTSMVLAELKGKMTDEKSEKMMMAALTKTISKIVKNQQADGTFAGNDGWASVLSQGLAGKGLSRAAQNGVNVDGKALERIKNQVAMNFDKTVGAFKGGSGGFGGGGGGIGGFGGGLGALGGGAPASGASRAGGALGGALGGTDAGVPLYSRGQNLGNLGDVAGTMRPDRRLARQTLERKDATKAEKEKAEATIKKSDEFEKLREDATRSIVKDLDNDNFVKGFGSNGGEEFLSFMNIGEALLMKGGADFRKWDKVMTETLVRVQDGEGSWSGHHCITGKTFCTGAALLVLMTDRAPLPCAIDNK